MTPDGDGTPHGPPPFTVREAVEADVQPLFDLIVAIAEHHGQRELLHASTDALRRDGFGPQPRFGALLAESNGTLVGYASYMWHYSIWLASPYMNVDDVYVAASHRGLGIGEALMLAARGLCRARGLHRVRWEVQPDNEAAIRFYERLGARMRTKGVFGWDV